MSSGRDDRKPEGTGYTRSGSQESGLKGVARCKFCGSYVQQDDRFCWSCGSELKPAKPPAPAPTPQRPAEAEPTRDMQFTLRQAFLAQRRGNLAEAEGLVREGLRVEPQSVPGLAMLSEILRQKGDLIGAVDAAQRATEAAAALGVAPPGALQRAREERAQIEQSVLNDLLDKEAGPSWNPMSLFTAESPLWHQSGRFFAVLAAAGLLSLVLALLSVLRGGSVGYVWLVVSLAAAGWCYYDAETRRESGLFWGPFVLCLGPFGLAIYLLARY